MLRERKAMEASKVSFADISFRAFQQTKGVKTSAASWRGAPVEFLLSAEDFFHAPFGCSAYEKPEATRLNLEVEITNSPLLQILQEAEQAIMKKAHADGVLEGTFEDAVKNFKSSICFSEKYSQYRFRSKINIAGLRACRVFEAPEKKRVEYKDVELRGAAVRPHICLKGLWKQGSQWGIQYECLNLLVRPPSEAPNPFLSPEEA